MLGTVRKWGNSAAVRLPANILESAHLQVNQDVDVREECGRIIIQSVRPDEALSMEDLTAAITDDNRHGEVNLGSETGGEVR